METKRDIRENELRKQWHRAFIEEQTLNELQKKLWSDIADYTKQTMEDEKEVNKNDVWQDVLEKYSYNVGSALQLLVEGSGYDVEDLGLVVWFLNREIERLNQQEAEIKNCEHNYVRTIKGVRTCMGCGRHEPSLEGVAEEKTNPECDHDFHDFAPAKYGSLDIYRKACQKCGVLWVSTGGSDYGPCTHSLIDSRACIICGTPIVSEDDTLAEEVKKTSLVKPDPEKYATDSFAPSDIRILAASNVTSSVCKAFGHAFAEGDMFCRGCRMKYRECMGAMV